MLETPEFFRVAGAGLLGISLTACTLPPTYVSELPPGVGVTRTYVRGTGGSLYVGPGAYAPPGQGPYYRNPQLRPPVGPQPVYVTSRPRYYVPPQPRSVPPRYVGNPPPNNSFSDFGNAMAPFLAAAVSGAINSSSPNMFGGSGPQQGQQNQPKKGKKHKKKDDGGQQQPSQPSQPSQPQQGSGGGPGGGPPGGGPPQ
jgi:hypothetical protein